MAADWAQKLAEQQMAKNVKLLASVKARTAQLKALAAQKGHRIERTQFHQATRGVVAFCADCNKDIWAKSDGTMAGDVLTRPCVAKEAK